MKPKNLSAYQLHPLGRGLVSTYTVTWNAHDLAVGVTWPEAKQIIAEHRATEFTAPRRKPHHRKGKA